MSVIALPNIAPRGPGAGIEWELRSNTARFPSPLTGYTRTLERFGSHWAAKLRYENLNTAEAARMRAFLSSLRGQAQRVYLRDFGYTQRGSFPAPELLTNNAFASGTTGWTAQSGTISVADGIMRVTPNASGSNPGVTQNVSLTLATPYALRGLLLNSGFPYVSPKIFASDLGTASSVTATGFGLQTAVFIPIATGSGAQYPGYIGDASGYLPSHYLEIGYSSMARCALVDNGPCFTQQSQVLGNAYWTKTQCSINTDAASAADRTTTADTIVENGVNASHLVSRTDTRTAAAADWCTFGYFRRASGTRNISLVIGRDASNYVRATFDLGTGTISVAAAATGDATNPRAFIVSLGGGDYYCAVLGRLTATTGLYLEYTLASGTTLSYAGDSTSGVHAWRCGAAQSSFPTRGMSTTTSVPAGTLQTGSALYLKGLQVSTNGLLLADDLAEIVTPNGTQFVRTRAALNSDAAGMGVWQFEPPLRESPVDNAGVIVQTPMIRAMLDDRSVRWSQRHAGFTDLEFTAVEDITV